MNKDNLLYTTIGVLIGFVSAYLLFEAMASRQPPRLTPELRAQIALSEEELRSGGAAAEGPTDARTADTSNPAMGGAAGPGVGGPMNAQVQQLKEYVEKNPNDADAVRQLANLNFEIRNWPRAKELYDHYLKLRPNDPEVIVDLGVTYRETQHFDQALERFRQARKLAPENWTALYNEVVVLAFDLKRYDEASSVLEDLQRMQPGNPDVAKLADAVARQRSAA
ncbi:MAG TPA: tetratricopeptide repeat protein [Thermoanaerobaculia bacterium]